MQIIKSVNYDSNDAENIKLFEAIDNLPRKYKFSGIVLEALKVYVPRLTGTDESVRSLDIAQENIVFSTILKNIPNDELKKLSDKIDRKNSLVQKELKKRLA